MKKWLINNLKDSINNTLSMNTQKRNNTLWMNTNNTLWINMNNTQWMNTQKRNNTLWINMNNTQWMNTQKRINTQWINMKNTLRMVENAQLIIKYIFLNILHHMFHQNIYLNHMIQCDQLERSTIQILTGFLLMFIIIQLMYIYQIMDTIHKKLKLIVILKICIIKLNAIYWN